jgi:hypothetical protein
MRRQAQQRRANDAVRRVALRGQRERQAQDDRQRRYGF